MAELYRDAAPLPSDAVYRVVRTDARPVTLLPGHDKAWKTAERIGWGPAKYRTVFRALWNDAGLAVRFDVCDDTPWHTMKRLDDPIWEEEVVELFLDPARLGRHYAEVEHLVARSRLSLEAVYGDFADGELTADSRELVVVCRRAAA